MKLVKVRHEPGHEKTSAQSDQRLDIVMSLVSVTKISSLMLASVAVQASLSLTWSETPEDTFSHDEAHMYLKGKIFYCYQLLYGLFS